MLRILSWIASPVVFILIPWQHYFLFGFVMGAIIVPLWRLIADESGIQEEIKKLHESVPPEIKIAAEAEDPDAFYKHVTSLYLVFNYIFHASICVFIWPTMLFNLSFKAK